MRFSVCLTWVNLKEQSPQPVKPDFHPSRATLFADIAVVLYAFLVVAWFTVFGKTAKNAFRGRIFLPPAQAAALGQ